MIDKKQLAVKLILLALVLSAFIYVMWRMLDSRYGAEPGEDLILDGTAGSLTITNVPIQDTWRPQSWYEIQILDITREATRQAEAEQLPPAQVREFVYFALQTVSEESGGDPDALNESTDWKCLTGETDCVEYANYGLFQLNSQYYTDAAQMPVQENITKGVAHALGLYIGCRGRKAEARRHYRAGGTC